MISCVIIKYLPVPFYFESFFLGVDHSSSHGVAEQIGNILGICWSNVSIVGCYIHDLETRTIKSSMSQNHQNKYELEQPNIQFELELSQIQCELELAKFQYEVELLNIWYEQGLYRNVWSMISYILCCHFNPRVNLESFPIYMLEKNKPC